MHNLFLTLLILSCGVGTGLAAYPCSDMPKIEPLIEADILSGTYCLVDLGALNNDLKDLSPHALPLSYAPHINNESQITYNSGEEGFIRLFGVGEASPRKSRMHGNCFNQSDSSSVLIRYNRNDESVEWAIGEYQNLKMQKLINLDPVRFSSANLYFRALNSQGTAVGTLRPSGPYRPLMRTEKMGLHHFGYWLGYDIEGVLWDVNEQGQVLGTLYKEEDTPPFFWSEKKGFFTLKNYEKSFERQSHTSLKGASWHFEEVLLDSKGVIYGTFVVDFPGGVYFDRKENYQELFGFMWYPESNEFRLVDYQGMRLSKAAFIKKNCLETLVIAGRLNGKAALKQRSLNPILLSDLVNDSKEGWELLEITSINAKGQMVGYGLKEGVLHAFFAERTYAGLQTSPILEAKPTFASPTSTQKPSEKPLLKEAQP